MRQRLILFFLLPCSSSVGSRLDWLHSVQQSLDSELFFFFFMFPVIPDPFLKRIKAPQRSQITSEQTGGPQDLTMMS